MFSHSVVSDSVVFCTVACQAPLSMGFSWQEYWNGLLFPPPRELPDSGIKPESLVSPALQADFFFFFFTTEPLGNELSQNPMTAYEEIKILTRKLRDIAYDVFAKTNILTMA